MIKYSSYQQNQPIDKNNAEEEEVTGSAMEYILYKKKLDFKQPDHQFGFLSNVMATENPDFEMLYPKVDYWLLEVDDDTGRVNREVGLNKDKSPIVLGPWGCNYGVWSDSVIDLDKVEHEKITRNEFEEKWEEVQKNLESI